MNTAEYASLDDAALTADLEAVDRLTGTTQPPPSRLEPCVALDLGFLAFCPGNLEETRQFEAGWRC